jgi:hypothetical protein
MGVINMRGLTFHNSNLHKERIRDVSILFYYLSTDMDFCNASA